jgi:isopenicillin-N epimerase
MASLKEHFLLSPDITYLNFGSFGACVKPVFEDYMKWQLELEQEPAQFITVNGLQYLKKSREALAAYIGCHADDVVYVTNPSYGVNTIAKTLNFKPGDEILTTNLEYGACDKTWDYYSKKTGFVYRRQHISLPIISKEKLIEDFFKGLSSKTKMIFISHITSATGLRLPVEEICSLAKQKGLLTFVDGAHAPGQIPIDLANLQADFYVGACHKWMMTPKGSSFLYVKKELQLLIDPLVVSWGYESATPSASPFLDYHQMNGTRDFSAYLTIPKAISFMKEHCWEEVSAKCRRLVIDNAARFCELLKTQPLCPLSDDFLVQMFSIPIQTNQLENLQRLLFEKYKIEIPLMRLGAKIFIRYSIQAFNSQEDLDILFSALTEICKKTDLIEMPVDKVSI